MKFPRIILSSWILRCTLHLAVDILRNTLCIPRYWGCTFCTVLTHLHIFIAYWSNTDPRIPCILRWAGIIYKTVPFFEGCTRHSMLISNLVCSPNITNSHQSISNKHESINPFSSPCSFSIFSTSPLLDQTRYIESEMGCTLLVLDLNSVSVCTFSIRLAFILNSSSRSRSFQFARISYFRWK